MKKKNTLLTAIFLNKLIWTFDAFVSELLLALHASNAHILQIIYNWGDWLCLFDQQCMIALHIFAYVSPTYIEGPHAIFLTWVMNCSFCRIECSGVLIIEIIYIECLYLMQNFAFSEFLIFFHLWFWHWHFLHIKF